MIENIEKTWQEYSISKDQGIKESLIIEYAPLVKFVAGRLSIHIGQHVDYEDLISYGIFGLIDAIDKFDFEKGVKFETYATLRIRGSIIDSIRKLDWIPRTLRQKNKKLEAYYTELEFELGREPTDEEFAEKHDITVSEAREMFKSASVLSLISLDDYLEQNHEIGFNLDNNQTETPEAQYEIEETKQTLIDAIENLTDKEQMVINLYYFEDLTLKEISNIMCVSESRISQIHAKAIKRLQNRLGKYKSVLFTT